MRNRLNFRSPQPAKRLGIQHFAGKINWTPVASMLLALGGNVEPANAQSPPNPPVITEPARQGQIVNAADIHMETQTMTDPDSGDTHYCSDWEIWAFSTSERLWEASCVTGVEKVHIHLGDGTFAGSQAGYKVEVAANDLRLPVNIAFKPNAGAQPDDPYFYVTELYGTIKVVTRNGAVKDYADNLINFNPTGAFPGSGEQGLSGIVVDAATGDVFASLLYDAAPPNGPHYPKVVRFHSNDGGLTAAAQTTILDMPGESQGQSHFISNLSIGPDGKLYVHLGDGFNSATALNLNSFRGKILRVNFDGTAPADNPFYNASDGITATDYVFAYGFRNPFGGDWRAADGFHYEVENGPERNDRLAKVMAGANYGWNGNGNSLTTNAIYNWTPPHAPVNMSFIQPQTFGGSGFPAGKMDHVFVTESGPTWASGPQTTGKRIVEFLLDAAGKLVSGPTTLVEYNGAGKATAVGLAAGPDGLYFTDLYKDQDYGSPIDRGANVWRVKFIGEAGFTANITSAKHFVGDGGTANGRDQGDTQVDETTLRQIHLPGYLAAIEAGVGSIMVSFSSWNGQKMHGNKYLLTDLLKNELWFTGFLISDWGGIDQLPGDYASDVETSINAGLDMIMVPQRYKEFISTLKNLVNQGRVPRSRIDDAVRRILRVKMGLGLFEHPFTDRALTAAVGASAHREVARECVRQSLVLLKNNNHALPLAKNLARIHVAGKKADDLGNQCGGWTISWQGRSGNLTIGTTILQALKNTVSSKHELRAITSYYYPDD